MAVLLDAHSSHVVAWAKGDAMPTELPLAALLMALRHPTPGLVHHADRDSHFLLRAYRVRLAATGIVPSMSRPGDCSDDAIAESLFATIKSELVDRER